MTAAVCAVALAVIAHGWLTTTLPVKDSPALWMALATTVATLILLVTATAGA